MKMSIKFWDKATADFYRVTAISIGQAKVNGRNYWTICTEDGYIRLPQSQYEFLTAIVISSERV